MPMSKARQQAEWLRVGMMTGWMKGVSPWKVIPRCYHPEIDDRQLSPDLEAIESDRAWRVLDSYMANLGKPNGWAG